MQLHYLTRDTAFPDPNTALDEPNGLLAIGGDLSTARLIEAYQNGIFPWFNSGEPALWWSPDPRAVIYPDALRINRSLKKFLRRKPYRVTLNHSFSAVIHECAANRAEGTWIGPEVRSAYIQLHNMGIAHSVEVWRQEQLVGGLYGIGQGKIFCGESMFSKEDNASKCALIALCRHLVAYEFALIDSQIINPHTQSLGAIEIPRSQYLSLLKRFGGISPQKQCWNQQELVLNH